MMYSTPELQLVGAASNLVLDTSPFEGFKSGRDRCSVDPDVEPNTLIYTLAEEAW